MIGMATRYPGGEEIPMEFDNSFTVQKPIDEVWSTMVDLERVVPCVPGARVIEKTGDQAVNAEVKIKLGAMNMNYSGPAEIVEQEQRLKLAFQALVYERCWTTRHVLTQLMEPSSLLGRALDEKGLATLARRSTDAAPLDEACLRAELLRMLEPWLTDAKAAWVLLVGVWDGEVDVIARREQAAIADAESESGLNLAADEVLLLSEGQLRKIAEAVRPVHVDSPGATEAMAVLSKIEPLRYAIAEEHGVSDHRPPESLAGAGEMFDRLGPFVATHPASQYFAHWCLQRIEQLSRATDLESFIEQFDRVWFLAVELTNAWEARAPLGLFNDPVDSQADFDRWAGDPQHGLA
jgi:hypothetical protein